MWRHEMLPSILHGCHFDTISCFSFENFVPDIFYQTSSLERLWKSRKSQPGYFLGSSPNGSFCTSETKHDIKSAPRPKLFVSARRLQEQRPQPRKICLGSSPGEDGFCNSETKHDRRTVPRSQLFVLAVR
jgi:hypothetical protein